MEVWEDWQKFDILVGKALDFDIEIKTVFPSSPNGITLKLLSILKQFLFVFNIILVSLSE